MSKVSNYLRTGENYLHVLFLEGYSRIINAETTVAQKLNQTSYPENGLLSFSGVLFWFFFARAKKNNNTIKSE